MIWFSSDDNTAAVTCCSTGIYGTFTAVISVLLRLLLVVCPSACDGFTHGGFTAERFIMTVALVTPCWFISVAIPPAFFDDGSKVPACCENLTAVKWVLWPFYMPAHVMIDNFTFLYQHWTLLKQFLSSVFLPFPRLPVGCFSFPAVRRDLSPSGRQPQGGMQIGINCAGIRKTPPK